MKKKCFVCQIWCNECEISKFSCPHKYSWGDVTASWWQFMHTPLPNLGAHQSWSRSAMCFCYYGPLKIGPLTRCHVTHDDVIKILPGEDRRLYGFYVYTKFHQNWNLFNGKSAAQKNPVQNLWDFSDKKKKKKILTKAIAFPLFAKACGKAKKVVSRQLGGNLERDSAKLS